MIFDRIKRAGKAVADALEAKPGRWVVECPRDMTGEAEIEEGVREAEDRFGVPIGEWFGPLVVGDTVTIEYPHQTGQGA